VRMCVCVCVCRCACEEIRCGVCVKCVNVFVFVCPCTCCEEVRPTKAKGPYEESQRATFRSEQQNSRITQARKISNNVERRKVYISSTKKR
jgi:hypothetical protein